MTMPRLRPLSTCSRRSSWSLVSWLSSSAVWTETMRYADWLRIETSLGSVLACSVTVMVQSFDTEAERPLGLLDPALEIPDRPHLAQVHPDGHQSLGDLRGQPRDDDLGAHEAGRVDRSYQGVRDLLVHVGDPGD